jgi:hypothetical protein
MFTPIIFNVKRREGKMKKENNKSKWTQEEDELLAELMNTNEQKKWKEIAVHLPDKTAKQCRERWHNNLNPLIKKEEWTEEEERILFEKQKEFGNKWSFIRQFLPGRTDNSIKVN